MVDVDVVVVNYRSAEHTARCVAAIYAAARHDSASVNIVIVNNDDPPTELEKEVSAQGPTAFVHCDTNIGFGAACNTGARLGNADFVLFMNPDSILHPGYFNECLGFIRDPQHADIAILGPAITNCEGALARTNSDLPSLGTMIGRCFGRSTFLPAEAHVTSGRVGQVMGAVFMIRRTLFERLGGFDERLFLYYEDVDLCARAAKLGAGAYYLKAAHATHIGRVSSSQDSGRALAMFLRSMLTYTGLHFGPASQGLVLFTTLLVELPLRLLQVAIGKNGIGAIATIRGYRLLLWNILTGRGLPKPRTMIARQ